MSERTLRLNAGSPYRLLAGVGGIGAGLFFALEGNRTLGRNESRPARQLDVRDYCKLHIIAHYAAVLLGARAGRTPFHVLPIGKVGDDPVGHRLREEMADAGMDIRLVHAVRERPTLLGVCFQYPDGSGGNITPVESAASLLSRTDMDRVRPLFAANTGHAIALAAPEVPLEMRHHFLKLATEYRALRVASFTSAEMQAVYRTGFFSKADLVSVNEDEAAILAGKPYDAANAKPFLRACAERLTAIQPRMRIVITAGKNGAYAFEDGVWDHCPAPEVTVASTAGAGDALLGGVLACLACGIPLIRPGPPRRRIQERPIASALDLGVLLAGFTVTSPHTIHPDANLNSMQRFARKLGASFSDEWPSWTRD